MRHFPALIAAAVLTLLAAPAFAAPEKGGPPWIPFACKDGLSFKVRFALGMAQLRLADGRTLALPRVRSGSGARYADDANEFWNKGDTAMLTLGKDPKRDCRVAG